MDVFTQYCKWNEEWVWGTGRGGGIEWTALLCLLLDLCCNIQGMNNFI